MVLYTQSAVFINDIPPPLPHLALISVEHRSRAYEASSTGGCPGPSSPDTWVDSWMMPDRDRSGAIGRAAGAWEAI